MIRVTVLYEDASRQGDVRNFGPHQLLLACVADRLNKNRHQLGKEIEGHPKKGAAKLRRACVEDFPALRGHVLAVFDSDRLIDAFAEPRPTTVSEALSELRREQPDLRFTPLVLERNLETVLKAAGDCQKDLQALAAKATSKDTLTRDRLLNRVAAEGSRSTRDCIGARVPTFGSFVDEVVKRYSEAARVPG